MNEPASDVPASTGWLNRTVVGAGLTSFLADVCYESAEALLPGFLIALHLPATALGVIVGTADAASNFAKLGIGWYSDRIGRRKALVVFGYALTGVTQALYALAYGFPLILGTKVLGWLGKGVRGPLRNAILADAVAAGDRGKAFGFHRAGDTVGAVLGPLIAFVLLRTFDAGEAADPTTTYRWIFALTLIPGIGSALTFALLIRERRLPGRPERKLWASLKDLPKPFWRWLVGVGVFGAGDFSDKLLIFASIGLLQPTEGAAALALGPLLYAWRNLIQAATSFPIGWLSDRVGPRRPLLAGYLLGATVMAAFAVTMSQAWADRTLLFALFALAGIYLAAEEALESVLTADLVQDRSVRGTAYGVMGMVNGFGDFLASVIAGLLMQYVSPAAAFIYAAAMMLLGSLILARVR